MLRRGLWGLVLWAMLGGAEAGERADMESSRLPEVLQLALESDGRVFLKTAGVVLRRVSREGALLEDLAVVQAGSLLARPGARAAHELWLAPGETGLVGETEMLHFVGREGGVAVFDHTRLRRGGGEAQRIRVAPYSSEPLFVASAVQELTLALGQRVALTATASLAWRTVTRVSAQSVRHEFLLESGSAGSEGFVLMAGGAPVTFRHAGLLIELRGATPDAVRLRVRLADPGVPVAPQGVPR